MTDALDRYTSDTRSCLAKLLGDGAVPHRAFDFRGAGNRLPEGTVFAVRALSPDELERAAADAFRFLVGEAGFTDDRLFTAEGKASLALEGQVQDLARALVDPKDPTQPFAKDAAEVRKLLWPDEVIRLHREWIDYQRERSLLVNAETVEKAEAIFTELGKGYRSATSLADYDFATLQFTLICGAALWFRQTKPASSDSGSAS